MACYKDVNDLVNGIKWVLENNCDNVLGLTGRRLIETNYSPEIIALKHIELYMSCFNEMNK